MIVQRPAQGPWKKEGVPVRANKKGGIIGSARGLSIFNLK
jgi:hypothetical protein